MNILLLDEDNSSITKLKGYLNELVPSSNVDFTNKIDEALSLAKNKRYDVAFMEIRYSSNNGISVAKELKNYNSKINIIFVTSHSTMIKEALKVHASGFIDKPVTKDDVASELSNLLYPTQKRVYLKTLGGFDVFIDNKLFAFHRSKSKELLAYLTYKQGSSSTRKELISVLFDNNKSSNQNYFSKIYEDLIRDLNSLGIDNLIIKQSNQYAINPESYTCDYNVKESASSYLQGYDWKNK